LVYAGINSSAADFKKGKNLHFRVFGIEPAAKGIEKTEKASEYKISEISRSSLFSRVEDNSYQRVTRLSKPYPNQPQLGAVVNGFAQNPELVVFDTAATPPNIRGRLESSKEIEDVDFIQIGKDTYLIAYCDKHDVFIKDIGQKIDTAEAREAYVTPFSKSSEKVTLPSFRALRWLTKDYILVLTNIHSNGGSVLQVLRLASNGKDPCRIVQSHRLPSSITKATALAVVNLTPPVSPIADQGFTQFVIAVAGHDTSISLFKMDIQCVTKIYLCTEIKPFRTFKNVHPLLITGAAFSNFTPPVQPVTASTPPQYLKLASIGVSNTVVVHTLPLFPVPLSVKKGQSTEPRYVVALPSKKAVYSMSIIAAIVVALLASLIVQIGLETRGATPFVTPHLASLEDYIPGVSRWKTGVAKSYMENVGDTVPEIVTSGFSTLLDHAKMHQGDSGVVVIEHSPDSKDVANVRVHDESVHGPYEGVPWERLSPFQKAAWKKHLSEAGHWAEGMGETIFKGVLFGEIAGAVGQAVAGGI
jgi:hypothetical protein